MLKSLKHNEEGTTAIEFSLLFIPYFFMMLGVFELSIMYASASLLEGATNAAARLIRTGQLQESVEDPDVVFRNRLCQYAVALIPCDDVTIEAIPLDSFAAYDDMEPEYDEDGNLVSQGFDAGGSSSRVLVRVAYRYHMLTPLIGNLLAGPGGSRLFVSTIVLQSEPYDFAGADS